MTARTDAAAAHELREVVVIEVDRDGCANAYGVAPCTAAAGAGNECYYAYATCQDKPHFTRTTVTDRFISEGTAPPVGEAIRPYIVKTNWKPTEISIAKGLAQRGEMTLTLKDEPCPDHMEDRHAAGRSAVAGGSYWTRYLARHKHLVGRFARIRRGFYTAPWTWTGFLATAQTELYVITGISGPTAAGMVTIQLQDPTKLLDASKAPPATDGKLLAALPELSYRGVAVSATINTVVLPADASAVDGDYVGQEIHPYANAGAGQRRKISAYTGATRTATVSVPWAVMPEATTSLEIGPLALTLAPGKVALYADPAVTGRPEFIRIGKEVIRYTAITGDVLSWPDTTYRAQAGSTAEDHKANDLVQSVMSFIDAPADEVIHRLLNAGGIADAQIDLAGIAYEVAHWMFGLRITAYLTAPDSVGTVLADLCIDLNAALWWDAPVQKVRMRLDMPEMSTTTGQLTNDEFSEKTVTVEALDKEVITRQSITFGLLDATADRKQAPNYQRGVLVVDASAESANERGREIPSTRFSYWLPESAGSHADAWARRRVRRLRNTPWRISFRLTPRNEVALGNLVWIRARQIVGADGQPQRVLCRVVRVQPVDGEQAVTVQSVGFSGRYAFVAPAGLPDYTAATEAQRAYAFVASVATEKMSNGDAPYLVS